MEIYISFVDPPNVVLSRFNYERTFVLKKNANTVSQDSSAYFKVLSRYKPLKHKGAMIDDLYYMTNRTRKVLYYEHRSMELTLGSLIVSSAILILST